MNSKDAKEWWEDSEWIKVDAVTYQLRKDVEHLERVGKDADLDFFFLLIKTANQQKEFKLKK